MLTLGIPSSDRNSANSATSANNRISEARDFSDASIREGTKSLIADRKIYLEAVQKAQTHLRPIISVVDEHPVEQWEDVEIEKFLSTLPSYLENALEVLLQSPFKQDRTSSPYVDAYNSYDKIGKAVEDKIRFVQEKFQLIDPDDISAKDEMFEMLTAVTKAIAFLELIERQLTNKKQAERLENIASMRLQ